MISKKNQAYLAELQKQKEKILNDMKLCDDRKKMKMKKVIQKKVPVVITNPVSESSIKDKDKMPPKFQIKSFSEIMQEANEREILRKRKKTIVSQISSKNPKLSLDDNLRNNNISLTKKLIPNSNNRNVIEQKPSNPSNRNLTDTGNFNKSSQLSSVKDNRQKMNIENNQTKCKVKFSKGIVSQNGIKRKVISRNLLESPPTSGQSRGIMAQNKLKSTPCLADSEEERDSDLDSFIDDTDRLIDDNVRKEIYDSLRYDPSKYERVNYYDDCKNMESSSKQIQIEENKSMKIAKSEDLKEAKLEKMRLKRKGKI